MQRLHSEEDEDETDEEDFRIQRRICQIEKEMSKKDLECKNLKEKLECVWIKKVLSHSLEGNHQRSSINQQLVMVGRR